MVAFFQTDETIGVSSHIFQWRVVWVLSDPGGDRSGPSGLARKKFVEASLGLEREQLVTTTDMRAIDKDLRHRFSTRRFYHRLPVSRIRLDIELVPLHSFLAEEFFGPAAERTPAHGVEEDIWLHVMAPIIEYLG